MIALTPLVRPQTAVTVRPVHDSPAFLIDAAAPTTSLVKS
jgi:hypothetical protein